MTEPWNHNIHYHKLLLASVPRNCRRALDVGCGDGHLTRKLALHCDQATGIDLDAHQIATANSIPDPTTDYILGDAITHPFPQETFDFIASVATLHHLPLYPALKRLRTLLTPGGTLAILGLYRPHTLSDYLFATAGLPTSWLFKRTRIYADHTAPMTPPNQTLAQIRNAAGICLPGATIERHLLFRYTLFWPKPADNSHQQTHRFPT